MEGDSDYDEEEEEEEEDLLVLALPLNLTLESPPADSVPACSKFVPFFQKKIFAVFAICSN